jgi:S1-C subfamily serine protease
MKRGCLILTGFIMVMSLLITGYLVLERAIEWQTANLRNDFVPVARQTRLDTLAVAQAATPTQLPPEVMNQLAAEDQVLINLYQRVSPAVVNIEVTQRTSAFTGAAASGSGFVYSADGYIITNAHVVQDSAEIMVTFSDGYITTGEIVGTDDYSDLAVLRVEVVSERLVPVVMGNSSQLQVGQRVVAIGNPFGLQSSMTQGIVSAVGRALPSAQLINQSNQRFNNPSIIQVDAPINPGNSGGPLLNLSGEVVGINAAIRTESGIFEGVAFAVPSNTLARVVPQIIETGSAEYSWLGVSTFPEETGFSVAALAEVLSLAIDYGILVEDVSPGSPAEQAGLLGGDHIERVRGIDLTLGGDIITAVNGMRVSDLDQLLAYLVENTSPGDIITLTVMRGSETLDIDVTLGVRP